MTDIAITAALMSGFALACVLAVVYLLSKRQIHVTQHNDNRTSVTADRTDSGTGGSGRVERFIVKWAFILLVAGIVIAAALNAIADAGRSITTALQSSAPVAQQAPIAPSVSAPIKHPTVTPDSGALNPLQIVIPLLIGAAASVWGYIAVTMIKLRRARRAAPTSNQRESHLESILPDAVNQL